MGQPSTGSPSSACTARTAPRPARTWKEAIENATITLARPDVMNALNTQMRAEILHAVQTAGREARVVVLTGEGRAFCSGQDLGDRRFGRAGAAAQAAPPGARRAR